VPRPRRNRRPPGNVHVVCAGRSTHDPVQFSPPLQIIDDGGRLLVRWDRSGGAGPITDFRASDGLNTLEFKCTACPRHWKRREDEFGKIAVALAVHQGITGDDNTPVVVDISRIERL
jgi:hypothetical protein